MNSDRARGKRYRLVLRGELGERFGFLFEGMQMDRVAGTTVLTGSVIDQAHLHGLIQQTRSWALSSSPSNRRARGQMRPNVRLTDRGPGRGTAAWRWLGWRCLRGEVIDIAACGLLFVAAVALAGGSRTERATS